MTQAAKATFAGSTEGSGNSRGLFRRASATRAASHGSKGSGAPAAKLLGLLAISLIALFASAAPASAASAKMGAISDVSYASAHVIGKTTTSGFGGNFQPGATYRFEYCASELDCTDNANWNSGFSGTYEGKVTDKDVEGNIEGLKGGTKYFVRLFVTSFLDGEATSPEPNPSFTTLPVDPPSVLAIDNASDVTYTTATVKGKVSRPVNVNPAFNVDCHFQYVTDEQYQLSGFTENPGDVPCEGTNPIEAPGASNVEAHLTGLANDTAYHLRLVVSNASPTTDAEEAASTFKTLKVTPPSVISTDNATAVEYTQAQVKGVVERPDTSPDPAFDLNCNFEYVTDELFDNNPPGEEFAGAAQAACTPNPVTAADTAPGATKEVKAALSGLAPSTEYHLRLAVSNLGGSDAKEAAATFTTQGPIPTPTVISTNNATEISYRTAKVSGEVERPAGLDPGLDIASCRFEHVTDEQFTANGFEGATQTSCAQTSFNGATSVSATLGLRSGVKYHFRLAAENAGGTTIKDAASTFTTLPGGDPTFTLDPPVAGYTTLKLSGTVTRGLGYGDEEGVAILQYAPVGTENWSPDSLSYVYIPPGTSPRPVFLTHTGLSPDTEYEVRMYVEGYLGGSAPPGPKPYPTVTTRHLEEPSITFDPVTTVTGTTAHFSATVNTNAPVGPLDALGKAAYETSWEFQCTPACPSNNLSGAVQGEDGSETLSLDAIRLEPDTSYDVKLVAHNEGYSVETPLQSFHTSKLPPSLQMASGASDGTGGYFLQGIVNPRSETITSCEFKWGPNSSEYAFSAPCSPMPSSGNKPVSVEAHLTGLTPDAIYHALLVVKYGAGIEVDNGDDLEFTPTLKPAEPCDNQQLRKENSSLALPECRAYEQVTDPNKEGSDAELRGYFGEDTVHYSSPANNIANSGQGTIGTSHYVSVRTDSGWKTLANLNGPSGSHVVGEIPSLSESFLHYSADFRTSLWARLPPGAQVGYDAEPVVPYLRREDGSYARLGEELIGFIFESPLVSDDLKHVVYDGNRGSFVHFGLGVYEYVGTGNGLPARVDVDNNEDPISACFGFNNGFARKQSLSGDGRVLVLLAAGGCVDGTPAPNPPSNELWARIGGTTSIHVSASRCSRTAGDPGGVCNGPVQGPKCTKVNSQGTDYVGPDCRGARFEAAAGDGSRVFFTTQQQLLDGDIDQTNDLYACDIPPGPLTPTGRANSCSALRQVSFGDSSGSRFERLIAANEDGTAAYFVARSVLADNEDYSGEEAVDGDHNLYLWRTDDAHPDGQTTFVARLDIDDVGAGDPGVGGASPEVTPGGQHFVFTTANQLVDTDSDSAVDVYRFDADAGQMTRVSTNVFGVAGNSESFGAYTSRGQGAVVSDDGNKVVFVSKEALSPLDGNTERDVYLWSAGHVYLISTGSVGGGTSVEGGSLAGISESGQNIYFNTRQVLSPSDNDKARDVYTARIGGGFSASPPESSCVGEACQPPSEEAPRLLSPAPPNSEGNVKPAKTCPKGKVKRGKKCVKKSRKQKHQKKKGHGKRASDNRGGSK